MVMGVVVSVIVRSSMGVLVLERQEMAMRSERHMLRLGMMLKLLVQMAAAQLPILVHARLEGGCIGKPVNEHMWAGKCCNEQ